MKSDYSSNIENNHIYTYLILLDFLLNYAIVLQMVEIEFEFKPKIQVRFKIC